MTWNPPLLAAVIATTVTCSAFAQDATSSTESQPAANPQASGATLKSAYKDHFLVGVAINRSIATGAAGRRGKEVVKKDILSLKSSSTRLRRKTT